MKRFKHILGVIDPRQPASTVLERAVSLAQNNQAVLTVVAVAPRVTAGIGMPDGGPISLELQKAAIADSRQQLENAVAPFQSQITIDVKVLMGTAFLEIIREVLRHGHDLVIKAPEDPAWLERLFGSDDMHLLRKCPCPVWLVKHSSSKSYRRILAAVDVDADHLAPELATRHNLNVKILELAASLALSDFAELHVAHAWEVVGENAMRSAFLGRPDSEIIAYFEQVRQRHDEGLEALLNEVIQRQGKDAFQFLTPNKHLITGQPRKEIPRLAKSLQVDLVVMGTVARTGVPGFFIGNTAESILEQIECSVMAVKPEGFETPVSSEERTD
jgi:nucleotide-binding universal stress UspA family protein